METHSGLDLAAGDGVFLVVVSQARGLRGDALEDVVDEGVHDAHGLAGDASVRVHLLQHLVDVDRVALLARLLLLLVSGGLGFGGGFLLALLGCDLARHVAMSSFLLLSSRLKFANGLKDQEASSLI